MKISSLLRGAEVLLPLLSTLRRRGKRRMIVENHELFHYLRLIETQKSSDMPDSERRDYREMVGDYLPAFESTLDEHVDTLRRREYWERFMQGRLRMVPVSASQAAEEFFHVEKVIFQCIRDDIYQEKDLFLYHIFTIYLLFLKNLVDSTGGDYY